MIYYHKFRLVHSDTEYSYMVRIPNCFWRASLTFSQDAAAAALFSACKIEDTLKKSRDILCAAYNLKLPPQEHLSPDDTALYPLNGFHVRASVRDRVGNLRIRRNRWSGWEGGWC